MPSRSEVPNTVRTVACLLGENYMQERCSRPETQVPQDFQLQVFFMNQIPLSLRVLHYGLSKIFRKFLAIFAAPAAPPVSLTPVLKGKNLQSEKF
jgi:hypothetical protein